MSSNDAIVASFDDTCGDTILRSKSGKKYAFDRANFTSYLNFSDMYSHIEDILVDDCKIATRFPSPVWMNKEGKIVDNENDSYGCKVNINIHRPDMGIVLDEVGCNLSQENDNANGGQLFVCGTNEQPYQTVATKSNHFTCLGLTRLDGEPLMCVIIIQGKRRDVLVEMGIDWNLLHQIADIDNLDDDELIDFLATHHGQNKLFPGGPVCNFKGKEVPSYVTFSEGGGINSDILTEIFRRLDEIGIYDDDRENGLIPFVLLDGHHSRFGLQFLEYINDKDHLWNVSIGVPYGTALWQVADSTEQNGIFKMLLTEFKKELFGKRISNLQQTLHLIRTDILPLVTKSWPLAFGNVQNNLKAIVERGWYPYNRALLLHPTLRATMTEEMLVWEKKSGLFGPELIKRMHDIEYVHTNGIVTISSRSESDDTNTSLNFNKGITAQHVSNTIMTENDRQIARQRSQKLKKEGLIMNERLKKVKKKMTAGRMVLELRQYGLKGNILDQMREIDKKNKDEDIEKERRAELAYMKLCYRADKAIEKNGNEDVLKWRSKADMLAYLKPLKRTDEPTLPSERGEIEAIFCLWKSRERKTISKDENVLKEYEFWKTEESNKKRGRQSKNK